MLGRLSWSAIPFDQPIIMGTCGVVGAVLLAILVVVTVKGWWPYLWREWITSVDHKRIGVMYMILGLVMLVRGFSDAIMMRAQQALAAGHAAGYLPPEHYDQIFSAHGTIMIFFVAMPFVVGLMNFAVPLQLADDLRPANAGRWELTVRSGQGSLTRYRTGQVHAPDDPASPGGPALELGARGLAALYAGTPVATLRRAGLAAGGSQAADAALDAAFAATPYMLDGF